MSRIVACSGIFKNSNEQLSLYLQILTLTTVIYLQCTNSVVRQMGVKPNELQRAQGTTALLGNWSATDFVMDRRHVFLFMSDRTLLSFLLMEGQKRFDSTIVQGMLQGGLNQLLNFMDFPKSSVHAAVADLNVIAVTKTHDRSIVSSMTALAAAYQHRIAMQGGLNKCDMTKTILNVNNGPQRRLGWATATEVTRELLGAPNRLV